MERRQALAPGTMVYGADGEYFGTVQFGETSYLAVETGDTPPVLYVPDTAIVETREDGAYLSVTAADARSQGWDQEPTAEERDDQTGGSNSGYSAIQGEDSLDDDRATMPVEDASMSRWARAAGADDALERPSGETGPTE